VASFWHQIGQDKSQLVVFWQEALLAAAARRENGLASRWCSGD
jgi:hypothetical protein